MIQFIYNDVEIRLIVLKVVFIEYITLEYEHNDCTWPTFCECSGIFASRN